MRARPATVAGLVLVAAAFVGLVGMALTSALVYYVTPSELEARPDRGAVRLYGVVEPGSIRWDAASSTLSFRVTDGAVTVAVTSGSLPTALFGDGIGVVLAGAREGPMSFRADEVLVKHSEVYAPLAPGATMPPGLLDAIRDGGA